MICYCRNVHTGKFHRVDVLSFVQPFAKAILENEEFDEIPSGEVDGGDFEIKEGAIHFLPTRPPVRSIREIE